MLDIKYIRENPEAVKAALAKRGFAIQLDDFLKWEEQRRSYITESDNLRAERNKVSEEIGQRKRTNQGIDDLKERMGAVSGRIKELDDLITETEAKVDEFLAGLPNIPDEDVPAGGKESNVVLHEWGKKPEFNFTPKDHVDLASSLGMIDYERGVKLGGSGNWIYTGIGAQFEWALLSFFIQEHLKDGYEFMLLPHILNYEAGYTAGQFPKFVDDVYTIRGKESEEAERFQFILPTAETALVNFHRDEVLKEAELPKKYFAYTPCYRKEAGGYRASERGTMRGHQFNKVEMFQYAHPDHSEAAHQELLGKAERLVQQLGLYHHVSLLAAEDASASMAKTYDVEVWFPSMGEYKEVSSISNAREYQARRGNIRYKEEASGKNYFLHTLNASGLATSRLIPAILEQHQQADGSVPVPEVLRPWLPVDVLHPKG